MKRILCSICILTVITLSAVPCRASETAVWQPQETESFRSDKSSKEIIYRDMVISMLVPYMQKEINNYYKEYLSQTPIIFPYSVDVVSAERDIPYGYLIRLEVIAHPFIGPINTVGDDRMIIETGAFGSVKVLKYEHLKSYPLPWNWQHIIKKPY